MMRKTPRSDRLLLGAICLLIAPMPAPAQSSGTVSPSKVIAIRYEEVKPGASVIHEKLESEYARIAERAKLPNGLRALTSVTGPSAALFISSYDSYAAIEESRRYLENNKSLQGEFDRLEEQHGQLLAATRTIMATYREDLSYRPDVDPDQMGYIKVFTVRVRPGHEADYAESIKLVLQIAKADIHWSMYQVKSGAPDGTYMVLMSIKTIGDMDLDPGRDKYVAGALSAENRMRVQKLASESYTMEMAIFAAAPKMSYVGR